MTKKIVLLQGLTSSPEELDALVFKMGDDLQRWRPKDSTWSIAEVLAHLIDVESRSLQRLRRIVAEEHPVVTAILPDSGNQGPTHEVTVLIDRFRQARVETIACLKELSPIDWKRPAIHETLGETNLLLLVQLLLDHDREHLNQIAETSRRWERLLQNKQEMP